MPYPESFIAPMRAELTRLGVRELRTVTDVDEVVAPLGHDDRGELHVRLRSGEGQAGIALALQHQPQPDRGGHGLCRRRHGGHRTRPPISAPYPPSSPSVGLLQDGRLVFMLQRSEIENRDARQIADRLTSAFDQFCAAPTR